ncbi:DUF3122 domain-containing protein [Synechococcus sp. CBW1107]|uniref:DUF3122 domain-containing protein n=1 Tax=Synechococcus sp. CBW1107 TaxID=2789857 RepID=UPI0018CE0EE4|nr:DUF3122 domain-containing protein [Synechococcus sp. CBW1107]QPN56014.1 DUF3122 domain-containing protein [Synechococcus sp. CBW1107]CAK6699839.1 hypothetical protein BBFGKLBO_02740 [Synechococcus sp. CBW1107]
MRPVIRRVAPLLLAVVLLLGSLVAGAAPMDALSLLAQLHAHPGETGTPVLRSLVSLRDLDDQAWQLVAFRDGPPGAPLRLRVVGYPGKVRLDHPTSLQVRSGPFQWALEDVTLESSALGNDGRSAAAEFDLQPLLADLSRDRPLRLRLPGVFTELPVPPFVVAEWRSLGESPA